MEKQEIQICSKCNTPTEGNGVIVCQKCYDRFCNFKKKKSGRPLKHFPCSLQEIAKELDLSLNTVWKYANGQMVSGAEKKKIDRWLSDKAKEKELGC